MKSNLLAKLVDAAAILPIRYDDMFCEDFSGIVNVDFSGFKVGEIVGAIDNMCSLDIFRITSGGKYIELTATGGCIWEGLFKPKWHCYVSDEEYSVDDNGFITSFTIYGTSKDMLIRVVECFEMYGFVVDGTVRFKKKSRFKPMYWKSIDGVWGLSLNVKGIARIDYEDGYEDIGVLLLRNGIYHIKNTWKPCGLGHLIHAKF